MYVVTNESKVTKNGNFGWLYLPIFSCPITNALTDIWKFNMQKGLVVDIKKSHENAQIFNSKSVQFPHASLGNITLFFGRITCLATKNTHISQNVLILSYFDHIMFQLKHHSLIAKKYTSMWPTNKIPRLWPQVAKLPDLLQNSLTLKRPKISLIFPWPWQPCLLLLYRLLHVLLTHWGRVTHICVGKLTIIGSDNGLSPGRRQAIIWTNAGILLIGPWGTNFSENLIDIQACSFKKMHLKMSSSKWRPFCLGLNVLKSL